MQKLLLFFNLFWFKSLTFESFCNELCEILELEYNQYQNNARMADKKLYFAFTIKKKAMCYKTLKEFKKDFFENLGIIDTEESIAAIEHPSNILKFNVYPKRALQIYLNIVQKKIYNPDINLDDIVPRSNVGIITNNLIKNLKISSDFEKPENIATNIPQDYIHNIKKSDDDLVFNENYMNFYACFFSNFNLNEFEYKYLIKIYESCDLELNQSYESICFVVVDIENKDKQEFIRNLKDLIKNGNNIFSYVKKVKHLNNSIIDNELNYSVLSSKISFFKPEMIQNSINDLFCIKPNIEVEKNKKIHYDTENFSFIVERLEKPSNEVSEYLIKNYPIIEIQKLISIQFKGLFQAQKIFFYKISQNIERKINNEYIKFKKISVAVFFKIDMIIKKFEFFYYESMDQSLILNYDVENVKASSKAFYNYLSNLKNCLNYKVCFFKNVNFHYSNFIIKNLTTNVFSNSIMRNFCFKNIGSYIDSVIKISEMLQKFNIKYNLYKFTSRNYQEIKSLFITFFRYDDQNFISDMTEINIENLTDEENTYYLYKIFNDNVIVEHLCILPQIHEYQFLSKIDSRKHEIITMFDDFIKKNVKGMCSKAIERDLDFINIEKPNEYEISELLRKNDDNFASKYIKKFEKKTKSEQILWISKYLNCESSNCLIKSCICFISYEDYEMFYHKKSHIYSILNAKLFNYLMSYEKMKALKILKKNRGFIENIKYFGIREISNEEIVYYFTELIMIILNFFINEQKDKFYKDSFYISKEIILLNQTIKKQTSLIRQPSFYDIFCLESYFKKILHVILWIYVRLHHSNKI